MNSLLFKDYKDKLDKEDFVALNINAESAIIVLRRVRRNCEVIIHKNNLPDHEYYIFNYILMCIDQLIELFSV